MIFIKQIAFIFFLFSAVNVIASNNPKGSKSNSSPKMSYDILMEKKDFKNPIEGLGLSPNGRYFVYRELKDIYYLDISSKTTHRVGPFSDNDKMHLKFLKNSSSFMLVNEQEIMVYNFESQEIQFDQTLIKSVIEAYLSEDGRNLVYIAAEATVGGGRPPAYVYFYDLINKHLIRTVGTNISNHHSVVPCQFGSCIAFRDYSFAWDDPLWWSGGHAQVMSMDGRVAWKNPFLETKLSDIHTDDRGQISVQAFEKQNHLISEDDNFYHYTVVDLISQQELFYQKEPSIRSSFSFYNIQSLGDGLFLGYMDNPGLKLLRSHGEVIDEIRLGSIIDLRQSKDLQYIMESGGIRDGHHEYISVVKIDKVNGKLKEVVRVITPFILSYGFAGDSRFVFARFDKGEALLISLATGEQFMLPTKSKVKQSLLLNKRPMALVLEDSGILGVVHFDKNQFHYQELYDTSFKSTDDWSRQWGPKIFSSFDEKIQVLWSPSGFLALKINDFSNND